MLCTDDIIQNHYWHLCPFKVAESAIVSVGLYSQNRFIGCVLFVL
jgi:hypothetical protein